MSLSPSKSTVTNTPSDAAFKKQADTTREALKNFNAISILNAPGPIKIALEELVNATVHFIYFWQIPFT